MVIKYVLLPMPTALAIPAGLYAARSLYGLTIAVDKGETFRDQLITLLPSCFHVCIPRENTMCERALCLSTLIFGWVLLLFWTAAVAQGLCPDRAFLFGTELIRPPRLAEAELWGACGFIFFSIHMPRAASMCFLTWDDMESLKYLAEPESRVSHHCEATQSLELQSAICDSTTLAPVDVKLLSHRLPPPLFSPASASARERRISSA